uniref:Uncharacterized protein n=1 Tax=Anguilla anguilla TaxID=7936 RepID=A0A0E9RCR4_ANGAN
MCWNVTLVSGLHACPVVLGTLSVLSGVMTKKQSLECGFR